jgi:hypothetical protein
VNAQGPNLRVGRGLYLPAGSIGRRRDCVCVLEVEFWPWQAR